MKETVRYRCLTIPGKVTVDIRIVIDTRGAEYSSVSGDGSKNTSITFYPTINLNITRSSTLGEDGKMVRAPWNPNDSLGMTKYNAPIFIEEIAGIQKDMKIPDLYTYHGKRLELNEEVAAKIRRVFMIGNVILELSAVVVVQQDESRVEGIKVKFNNEQSTFLLTLNELNSLVYNLTHLDVDSISMLMYLNYISRPDHPKSFEPSTILPKVDILPLPKD